MGYEGRTRRRCRCDWVGLYRLSYLCAEEMWVAAQKDTEVSRSAESWYQYSVLSLRGGAGGGTRLLSLTTAWSFETEPWKVKVKTQNASFGQTDKGQDEPAGKSFQQLQEHPQW
jgi:hypothetical protein